MSILEYFESHKVSGVEVINWLCPYDSLPDQGFVFAKSVDSYGFSVYVIFSVFVSLDRLEEVAVFNLAEYGLASLTFYLLSRDISSISDVMRYCIDLIEED